MLKPSRHWVLYNALTYAEKGLSKVSGNVRNLSKKPRLWRINVALTLEHSEKVTVIPLTFNSPDRFMLSEMGQYVNQEIHDSYDLTKATKCMVKAYILTENGQ